MKKTIILFVIFAFLSISTFSVVVSQEVKEETKKTAVTKTKDVKKDKTVKSKKADKNCEEQCKSEGKTSCCESAKKKSE
jgi:uncharacterized membrane protein